MCKYDILKRKVNENESLSFAILFWFLVGSFSKMPEREDDHLTPATRLLEKRREMSEVEQALAAQKEVKMVISFKLNLYHL